MHVLSVKFLFLNVSKNLSRIKFINIKDSGRYHIAFALSGYIVLIIVYSLRLVIIEIVLVSKGVS